MNDRQVERYVVDQVGAAGLEGASVLVIVPDGTRTAPVPLLFDAVYRGLSGRASRIDVMVALGTHRPMTEAELDRHFGVPPGGWAARYPGVGRANHDWADPEAFVDLGEIGPDEISALSGGRLRERLRVRINRAAVTHDALLIVGPVFPHEVVGFSGGNKYLFPGIGGQDVIDVSHWLGALIGTGDIIGVPGLTPVRALVDRAAGLGPSRRLCLAVVVTAPSGVHGAFFGTPEDAWRGAADLSARVHVRYLDRAYPRVLAVVPRMYEDIWTAAKGVYKTAPVVADGGEVVLLAPHVTQFSSSHGPLIERVGYHCRDYLLGHWSALADVPRGVLAHSVHVRGEGEWDAERGERCRIAVTLATGIDPDRCAGVGLGYRDPAGIDPAAWAADPDTLVVEHAGEALYRLSAQRDRPSW
jgi:nickel-dependent lactate racemase